MTLTVAAAVPLAAGLRLSLAPLDYALVIIYFIFVIGIGFALRRLVQTSTDFFLSGRSLPTWITGIAFISANLGAIEILSMAANGAEYGISTVHYYWIGAVPAMVFLGVVMMPFYYGSRVRSVPEYLLRRFDRKTHLVTALIFVLASVLIAGVNLYALAFVLESLLGIPLAIAIIASALFVLSYILLGGLSSAIYNEVMQFFVILLALIPVIIVVLKETGGIHGLFSKLATQGAAFTHPWNGTSLGGHNPFGDWIGIVFGLGFCLSFAYWTTNFAEVQRGMSAKDESSARLTPIVAAYPKVIIPLGTVIPGMAAILLIPGLGTAGGLTYNDAIPALYNQYLPLGVLGVAVTGLLAAFMAGMAANVSSFNAVWTYDIWQNYLRPGRPDQYYLRGGPDHHDSRRVHRHRDRVPRGRLQQHRELLPGAFLVLQRADLRDFHLGHVLAQGRPRLGVLRADRRDGVLVRHVAAVQAGRDPLPQRYRRDPVGRDHRVPRRGGRHGHRDHLGHAEAPVRVARSGLGTRGRRRGRGARDGRPRALVQVSAAVGHRRAHPVRAVLHLH